MIKINLLPKTLAEKALIRNTAILFGVLLLVLIAAGVGYSMKLQRDVEDMEAQAAAAEQLQQQVKAIQDYTTQLKASVQTDREKLDFIRNVLKYNLEFPKLYEKIAMWTYNKVVLTGLESDGQGVTLRARVRTIDDLGRYLLNMYQATDLFTQVQITSATGFADSGTPGPQPGPSTPGGQIAGSQASLAGLQAITTGVSRVPTGPKWIDFVVACKLRTPIVAPTAPGAGQTTGGGPGMPGAPMGGPPMPGAPGAPPGGGRQDVYPSGTPDLERQMGGVQ